MGGFFSGFFSTNSVVNAFTGKGKGFSDFRPTALVESGKFFELGRKGQAIVKGTGPGGRLGAIHNFAVDAKHSKIAQAGIGKLGAGLTEGLNQAALKSTMGKRILHDQKRIDRKKLKDKKKRGIKDLPKEEIIPEGEFAYLFGPFMKDILLKTVSRDNFIDEFIDAINGMAEYNNRNDLKKDEKLKELFEDLKEALINHSFTKKLNNLGELKRIKNECIEYLKNEIKELRDINPKYQNKDKEEVYNNILEFIKKTKIGNAEEKEIKVINKGINDFLDEKNNNKEDDNIGKKFNQFVDTFKIENFVNEVHEIIKSEEEFLKNKKARQELVKKLAKENIKLKEDLITSATVFIELNLSSFLEKIEIEIKEINKRIKEAKNTTININPVNKSIIEKIGTIIRSHQYFSKELFKLFSYVKNNTDLEKRKVDLVKIYNLCAILKKINNLDLENYDEEVKNENVKKFYDCEFSFDLEKLYEQTAIKLIENDEKKKQEKYKPTQLQLSVLPPGKTPPKPIQKKIELKEKHIALHKDVLEFQKKIEGLDMNNLQDKFNELFTKLYRDYIPTEKASIISGIIPPSKVTGSINYKFLLDIFPIFIKKILELDKALQKELMKEDFDIDKIELFESITQLKVMFVDILKNEGKGNFGNFNKYVANLTEKHKVNKKNINNDIEWYKEDFGFFKKENIITELDGIIENLISNINKITKKYFPDHTDITKDDPILLNKLREIVNKFNEKAESLNKKNENNEKKDNQIVIQYLQKLKRIKTIIDVLITKVKPSDYNKIRYDVKSSEINEDIKENLENYLSKNGKSQNGNSKNGNNKNENSKNVITSKSNEELITELNALLNEMYKKFLPEEKIPVMGKNSKQIYPNSNVNPVIATN